MFDLTIVTPDKVFYQDKALSLIAPGSEGYLGILSDHAPLITALIPGKLLAKNINREELVYAISGGFLEVANNQVTILADSIELGREIDIERAQKAKERALQRINSKAREIDIPRALAALKRAENRIKIYIEESERKY